MDAFEQLIADLLRRQGYWVETSVKVDLTKEEKREINRPSTPRWEIDVVAYSGRNNLLRVIECKSYLDSSGVGPSSFTDPADKHKNVYKLFNEPDLREVVFQRLKKQMYAKGMIALDTTIRLGLACGKIKGKTGREDLVQIFKKRDWDLFDKEWIANEMKELAKESYQNQVSSVVSKILLR